MLNAVLLLWMIYLSVASARYWLSYLAAKTGKPALASGAKVPDPLFLIVSPCHNGEASLPGLLDSLSRQTYPKRRYQVLILADNCSDGSARIAAAAAAAVYERTDPERFGKGYALQELLEQRLRSQPFDALILLDVDGRVESDFLDRVAGYLKRGASVLQGATASKNPSDSPFTRVGHYIQSVIRVHQAGSARLGLPPIMIGSHGIAISRQALDRLDWILDTGRTSDDLELGLRCALRGIPVTYADDLHVRNDLPGTFRTIRRQRRRWTCSALRCLPAYGGPLLRKAFQGDKACLDNFLQLISPSFSNLALGAAAGLGLSLALAPALVWSFACLLAAHLLYVVLALYSEGETLAWRDGRWIAAYLFVRAWAWVESLIFIRSKQWWPTPHGADDTKKE